ncbi:MAG: type II toxin-antitoxin system death-on-curing family toxin [Fimbriimonadaceae bacterium]|nr:type II toxin-antitoxin system death-on-curing family toxin [Fimbriimonadaceae bacterium]
MQDPVFLTLDEIKFIHENQIQLYGGSLGIRDEPALLSALEAPRWAYQHGQTDWIELAAIYFYHLMMNHGFTDGNKRVGTVAAILFLDLHGYWLEMPDEELEQLALQVAAGELEREEIAPRLRPYVTTTGEA